MAKIQILMIAIVSCFSLISCMEEGVRIKGVVATDGQDEETNISILVVHPLTIDTCYIALTKEGVFEQTLPIKEESELYLIVNVDYVSKFLAEGGDVIELSWESRSPIATFKFADPSRIREQELRDLLNNRFTKKLDELYQRAPQTDEPCDPALLDEIERYVREYRQTIEDFEQTHGVLPHKKAFLIDGYFGAMNIVKNSLVTLEELKKRGLRSGLPEDTVKGMAAYEVLPFNYLAYQPYRSFLWDWSHLKTRKLTGPADSQNTLYDRYIERMHTTFHIIRDQAAAEWSLAYRAQFAKHDLPVNETILYLHHLEKNLSFPWAKEYVQQIRHKLNPLQAGNQAPDFQFMDESGKVYTLNDFCGKYLYIGFWSKTCRICHREFKQIPALREKYQDYDDRLAYAFVYVGTEENERWTDYIDRYGSRQGINLRSLAEDEKVYDITAFPIYILISPDGKIVEYNVARPSELLKQNENLLDKVLLGSHM